jgi:hypothetical protein
MSFTLEKKIRNFLEKSRFSFPTLISVSKSMTFLFDAEKQMAGLTAVLVFATPPFPLAISIVLVCGAEALIIPSRYLASLLFNLLSRYLRIMLLQLRH